MSNFRDSEDCGIEFSSDNKWSVYESLANRFGYGLAKKTDPESIAKEAADKRFFAERFLTPDDFKRLYGDKS